MTIQKFRKSIFQLFIGFVLIVCSNGDSAGGSWYVRDNLVEDKEVNTSFFHDLAPGAWYELPNSHMAAVVPVPPPPGRENQSGIMTAWNGGAWDSTRSRLIVWGGGHSDGGDNSIYVFDLDDLEWAREFTTGVNENGYYASCTDNPKLNIPLNSSAASYPDGSPIVYHTYDALQYDPSSDTLYAFANRTHHRCGGELSDARVHTYNFTTKTWRTLDSPGKNWGTAENASAYDSLTRKVWIWGLFGRLVEFDIASNTAADHGSYPMIMGVAEIDRKNRLLVGINADKVWAYELETGVSGEKATVGGPSINASPGLVYDSSLEKIVMWNNGASLWSLNTDTAGTKENPWVWTEHPPTDGTTDDEPGLQRQDNGTFGRFQYSEEHNLYILVNSTTQNVWLRRMNEPWGNKKAKITTAAGPERYFDSLTVAFSALTDGDTLTIRDGSYPGPWTITENDITIRAESRRGVELTNSVSVSHGIINYSGDNVTFDGIVFRDAFNGHNAAGIWANAGYGDLTIKNCTFDNNDNGILTGDKGNGDTDIIIESSEFRKNGTGTGQAHQMYVGTGTKRLTVRYCYIHDSNSGQGIKSRAKSNYILYNRITDETDGNYNIDIPYGGPLWVVGNIIEQGNGSDNEVMMTYGVESYWILRIKNAGPTVPGAGNRIIGRDSGAQCLIPADRFCQIDCPGEGTGDYATQDRATGIQCWHYSGPADSTPDWIPGETLDLYQFNGTTLVQADWAVARSEADPPTYLPSMWKPPYGDLVQRAYIVNNTIVNNKTDSFSTKRLIHLHTATELLQLTNNIFYSDPAASWGFLYSDYGAGALSETSNINTTNGSIFADLGNYDFAVDPDSPIFHGAHWTTPLIYDGFDAAPSKNYSHPYSYTQRHGIGFGAIWRAGAGF